ncbi:hypothetical protein SAMN04489764_2673 [Thermostaphylospora chromogena]|uniref:Uncharacterized protein n=1 Tax=Thermostaphylospora chromogena TaxID=35622 RepID=A0A1H1EXC9_9ACTN|nr:hypothetical protein SAMN04489764_2673 [Thermostaphylospora chromogena]
MSYESPIKLQKNPLLHIYKLLWSLSDSLFAEIDSFAWTQDWSIERRLSRHVYRNRMFDSLVPCSTCQGVLPDAEEKECRICSGTGHLILIDIPGGDV